MTDAGVRPVAGRGEYGVDGSIVSLALAGVARLPEHAGAVVAERGWRFRYGGPWLATRAVTAVKPGPERSLGKP